MYILRRETQFLRLSTDKLTKLHTKTLNGISQKFAEKPLEPYVIFTIRPGHQEALGEEMTKELGGEKGGQLTCIGYDTFQKKWGKKEFSASNMELLGELGKD